MIYSCFLELNIPMLNYNIPNGHLGPYLADHSVPNSIKLVANLQAISFRLRKCLRMQLD